jgi:hypothetical protein
VIGGGGVGGLWSTGADWLPPGATVSSATMVDGLMRLGSGSRVGVTRRFITGLFAF